MNNPHRRQHRGRRPPPFDWKRNWGPDRMRVEPVDRPLPKVPFPTPEEYTAELQKKVEETLAEFRSGLEAYLEFLSYLLPAQLALTQRPVTTLESGHYQPRMRKQITYHTHPEKVFTHPAKTLTHQQRSIADMVAEKELDLLDLAKFTAYYKLTSEHGTDKGRLVGQPLPDPHDPIIRALLARHIQTFTLRDYCVERSLIDTAIWDRQSQKDLPDILPGDQPAIVPEEREQKPKRSRHSPISE